MMQYRRLGKSGLQVSVLSFGSWLTFGKQIDEATAEACMVSAYDSGVNFFDNAEVYAAGKSETLMGKILKKNAWKRDTYVLSSKVFWGGELPNQKGLSRKHLIEACHASLKRLETDYLDLYFCHRPDRYTPIEETVWTMNDLIRQGKILYWGTSEWSAQEIQAAIGFAREYRLIPPTMEQPQYNMFHRERMENEYARIFQDYGLGTTIWSPLASGLLTGKYIDKEHQIRGTRAELAAESMGWLYDKLVGDEAVRREKQIIVLQNLAREIGMTLAQMALLWCIKNPNVSTAITGASKPLQVIENMRSLKKIDNMTEEVMQKIEEILQNKPKLIVF
jgi:voltage-dependent potassium channel beta subunit